MAKAAFKTVEQYLAAQPDATRAMLEQVRAIIRTALPGAEEVISYQIPAYRLDGQTVVFFAGWTAHYSLYPASEAVVSALADELRPYTISKGTIRFPLGEKVPTRLIRRIVKLLAKEAAARAADRRRESR